MVNLKITYKGKQYNGFKEAVFAQMVDKLTDRISQQVEPYLAEVQSHGGEIEIVVPEDLKGVHVSMKGIPEELADRIKEALRG